MSEGQLRAGVACAAAAHLSVRVAPGECYYNTLSYVAMHFYRRV